MNRGREVHGGDVLGEYVDNMLDVDEAGEVERHLAVCQHCRASVDEQRELVVRLRSFSLGHQGQHDLVAGLMGLAQQAHSQVVPIRPSGPAMLHVGAPAQYTSARRSVACAVFAVAGCLGAALVAVQVPTPGTTAQPVQLRRGPVSVIRQVPAAGPAVVPAAAERELASDPLVRAAMVRSVGP